MRRDEMEFAALNSGELTKVQEAEKAVSQQHGGKEVILLAYTKK
ncbi:hypothetical protein [Candidatus Formimonas warabiya]|nr:hypothetical protein [Candidatus Formimonas warabiya]